MRLNNGLFAEAVNYLIDNGKVKDQQDLSARTGITGTTISRILNDKVKQPSAETMQKLFDAFPGLFNPKYFRGESEYLLMEDYIDARNEAKPKQEAHLDNSSLMNAAIAAKDETIASLHREIKTKDDLILALKNRIEDLESRIAKHNQKEINDYPFKMGVAER